MRLKSFMPDRIVSVVSDLSRNIIYTLTANSVISLYSPTSDKSVHLFQTIQNLYKLAQEKAPGSPALTPKAFQVISLHIIDPNESRSGVQLMAITTNGVRLYFAPSAQPYSYYSSGGNEGYAGTPCPSTHPRAPPPSQLAPPR